MAKESQIEKDLESELFSYLVKSILDIKNHLIIPFNVYIILSIIPGDVNHRN